MNKEIIHIDKLAKKYKDSEIYAVKPMNLSISSSDIFGLLGPNGAGKTTLISMICGLLKPTSGNMVIDGLNFKKDRRKLQYLIGVVPQEYALYPTLTAFENLLYFGAMYGLKGKDLKEKVNLSLTDLGLRQFANKKVKSFSGGMKRRVNLIAGILHEPKILFLDEPTVGVDVQSKNVIFKHLKALNENGTTIIYSSHHMEEAQDFCTDVAIIDEGKIIAKGSPQELIKSVKGAVRLEDVYLSLTGEKLRDNV
jgi:ABC-2 type transport system ATP-binding protein